MKISELIEQAKKNGGMTYSQMAAELDVKPSTFTAWKLGEYRPGPTEIVYLEEKAGLEPFSVLAEVETAMHPAMASVWKRAVSHIRQNQGLSRYRIKWKKKGPTKRPFFYGLNKGPNTRRFR